MTSQQQAAIDADTALQPLREVGSLEKTQHWNEEDIIQALRLANLRGIPTQSLYNNSSMKTSRIPVTHRRAS